MTAFMVHEGSVTRHATSTATGNVDELVLAAATAVGTCDTSSSSTAWPLLLLLAGRHVRQGERPHRRPRLDEMLESLYGSLNGLTCNVFIGCCF